MITLLIIADDFTGALDTGVQFAASGTATRVITNRDYDYRQADEDVSVLVMDAETRHLDSGKAYEIVYNITKKAVRYGIPYIYKKTDSALRGNIGSELTAVLDAAGEKTLSFIPAFPKMGRITKNGIHYIDGIPVEKSAFGKDPYEPVTCSYVPDIIKLQSKAEVKRAAEEDSPFENQNDPGIIVWDAESDKQLKSLGERLYKGDKLHIMAGCAGFASVLPQLLGLEGNLPSIPSLYQRFFVVCGSVNPITVSQMDYAENHNFYRIRMSTIEKLKEKYWQSDVGQKKLDYLKDLIETKSSSILDSNDLPGSNSTKEYAARHNISSEQIRVCIAKNIGCFVKELIRKGFKGTIMITGGDTLIGCMEQMEVYEMEPICELAPGIVLSRFISQDTAYHVISKSGGFGGEKLLTELAEQILTYKWN